MSHRNTPTKVKVAAARRANKPAKREKVASGLSWRDQTGDGPRLAQTAQRDNDR